MGRIVRVLVTGAAGFVGSHAARILVDRGHAVFALVRKGSSFWRIRDLLPSLTVVEGDLLDRESADELARVGAEACLHVAWYAELGRYLSAPENVDHLEATLRLARALAGAGCRRFVGVGTCLEYGPGEYGPGLAPHSEDGICRPDTLYGAAKLAAGLTLVQFGRVKAMRTAWARLFHLYGPFEDEQRFVPSLVLALLRGGRAEAASPQNLYDYLEVGVAARALASLLESDYSGIVNVASGRPVTSAEIARQVESATGRSGAIGFGATGGPTRPSLLADVRLLTDLVGHGSLGSLEEGLRGTVAWWREWLQARGATP